MCMWGPLPQAPVPAGHLRPGAPARRPGAAFPERVQDRAVEGAREEPGQGCALCQGAAAFPAQPGGLGGPAGSAWGPAWGLPRPFQASSPALLQDTSDCYLELFPSHLYFQAHGSEGLTFQVRGNGQTEEAGKREGGCRPLGGGGRGSGGPCSPIPCALAGAVTTGGAECLPARGVSRACLPDHRCVGHEQTGPSRAREQGLLSDSGLCRAPGLWLDLSS